MKTFLLAWNPKYLVWDEIESQIDEIEQSGNSIIRWSIRSHKQVKLGDRVFLMRLGKKPKGIIGSGYVVKLPFLEPHWNRKDEMVPRILIKFEVLINSEKDTILSLNKLNQGKLSKVNWTPHFSGIEIKPEFTEELEDIWSNFLKSQNIKFKSTNFLK